MATRPGILSDWPWQPLGKFKYVILVPSVLHSVYSFATKEENERDLFDFLVFPFLLFRVVHHQIWISLCRYVTAKGKKRIVDKGIEFGQVDRESNWDDQILLNGVLFYVWNKAMLRAYDPPLWRTDGAILALLLHIGPVEFIYYWLHRALHNHFLYARYHSHHHSSIVTEPITSLVHPFAEQLMYFSLMALPLMGMVLSGTISILAAFAYITYIDFMNDMGHCNIEFIPQWIYTVFPPLKYLLYTPTFHSRHHTQFRTNYSLFVPLYDYIYGTVDESTDDVYETSLARQEESPDVVHLTHLTTVDSIYHLQLGLASMASYPYKPSQWYLMVIMWPVTCWSMILTWVYGHAFVSERNAFKKLKLQSWVVPRYNMQYSSNSRREGINNLIEEAILKAEKKGAKHEELNMNGELYIQRHPQLRIKIVDGSSLAAAIVLQSIPKETTQVILRGKLSKVASTIAFALCQKGIQVITVNKNEYMKLKQNEELGTNVVLSESYNQKIWLAGDGLTEKEQLKALKGTLFIPFSPVPPRKVREDCYYHATPAMVAPKSLENLHSCENWLQRRVMSAARVAGIVHALEGWDVHECGNSVFNTEKVWEAALQHGFRPLTVPD
ncbi:hypothetical protein SLEP1_g34071 [Rubroshorea leprosula]|uniref:Uncharacterized protein n=1 Tax=Rubroshorea leprosula TaxID=152421 RepID=A0AAV5KIT0_9ROSI|nr:hypothetical protein SLEP1_g34071 [Rubroshorea leprosula]